MCKNQTGTGRKCQATKLGNTENTSKPERPPLAKGAEVRARWPAVAFLDRTWPMAGSWSVARFQKPTALRIRRSIRQLFAAGAKAVGEELLFRSHARQRLRALEMLRRLAKISQVELELGNDRVQKIIRIKCLAVGDKFNGFQTRFRSAQPGDGHGAIERHDRRTVRFNEDVVKR